MDVRKQIQHCTNYSVAMLSILLTTCATGKSFINGTVSIGNHMYLRAIKE